ncbi:hypothetical protein BJX66DRAFT_318294 [Aspergillus keveii]|uniref:Uncharacterized protein n=1 Tax=Aspergillus keveii TaxID=714993 RepID=A0ABR4FKG6_9EURO
MAIKYKAFRRTRQHEAEPKKPEVKKKCRSPHRPGGNLRVRFQDNLTNNWPFAPPLQTPAPLARRQSHTHCEKWLMPKNPQFTRGPSTRFATEFATDKNIPDISYTSINRTYSNKSSLKPSSCGAFAHLMSIYYAVLRTSR